MFCRLLSKTVKLTFSILQCSHYRFVWLSLDMNVRNVAMVPTEASTDKDTTRL